VEHVPKWHLISVAIGQMNSHANRAKVQNEMKAKDNEGGKIIS